MGGLNFLYLIYSYETLLFLTQINSISELYDTIIWSVAISPLGFSTTGSTEYSTSEDDDFVIEEEEDKVQGAQAKSFDDNDDPDDDHHHGEDVFKPDGSNGSGSTAKSTVEDDSLSTIGKMHVKQLQKRMREEELALQKKHKEEIKQERRQYRMDVRQLKSKHANIVELLLKQCVDERYRMREGITQRMQALTEEQELSTKSMQESIQHDINVMKEAWDEHKRLEDAEKRSFDKAQALISAQVFHEVRNALSSVVAMSEMTNTLQDDSNITPQALVASVNEMLQQNSEVVRYSLQVLNTVLDLNKIKTNEFSSQRKSFDLAQLMQRAIKMQVVKAQTRGVRMSFTPPTEKCVAFSDDDIILRVVTNFISVSSLVCSKRSHAKFVSDLIIVPPYSCRIL